MEKGLPVMGGKGKAGKGGSWHDRKKEHSYVLCEKTKSEVLEIMDSLALHVKDEIVSETGALRELLRPQSYENDLGNWLLR